MTTLQKYDVYGLGAALVDTEIEASDSDLNRFGIDKGVMTLVDEARQHELIDLLKDHLCQSSLASGGSAANSIIAAQYFGAKTFYSCKVANDDNGHFYLKDLADAGVDYSAKAEQYQGITGKCLVMITPDAERTMNTFLGVSETLSVEDIDEQALSQSSYAYIEGYLVTSVTGKAAAIKLRQLAEQHQVRTAISLSDPFIAEHFNEGISEMVGERVDILFCNETEALSFTRSKSLDEAIEALKARASGFVITRGAQGAVVYDGSEQSSVSSPSVKAVDTNGAGDMFAGAFLYCLSQGKSYPEAAGFAAKAAAKVVSQYGPRLRPEQYAELLQA